MYTKVLYKANRNHTAESKSAEEVVLKAKALPEVKMLQPVLHSFTSKLCNQKTSTKKTETKIVNNLFLYQSAKKFKNGEKKMA